MYDWCIVSVINYTTYQDIENKIILFNGRIMIINVKRLVKIIKIRKNKKVILKN